ncbi:response regulator transcription factor [Nocardia testacea]|uniref:response regulator transcription factor n=1 Tax=Nocardia testacea TaxID=248551 RepID=UPI0033DD9A44
MRVVIADDHPVVRAGMAAVLDTGEDIEVVGEAGSGEEALLRCAALRPDLVLLDLRMGGIDGAETTRRIREQDDAPRIVILTTYDDAADIFRCIEAGAVGYLLKGSSRTELIAAVHAAARGETVLTPSLAPKLREARSAPAQPQLSTRERDVLELVARGHSNPEIAARLYIAEATVKTHLLRIFKKLGVSDRTAAVTTALGRGIIRL